MNPQCLLTLRPGAIVTPGVWLPASPSPKPPDPPDEADEDAEPLPITEVHAFIEAFKPKPQKVNSVNADDKFYVIIGRGFAGLTNHLTLRRSDFGRKRIGKLQVIHVGFADPWLTYTPHNMNQGPELNIPPGYSMQPAELPPPGLRSERWLMSEEFSAMNCAEELALEETFDRKNARLLTPFAVTRIEEAASADDPYLVYLHGVDNPIKAQKIDICTGTGQQTMLQTVAEDANYGVNMTAALWNNYVHGPRTNANKPWTPKVISAEMYVLRNVKVPEGALVCITGASPASIQAAEHALALDRGNCGPADEVLLVNSAAMNGGFLPIGRLDGLARLGTRAVPIELPDRYTSPVGNLIPNHEDLWFAEGYRIESVREFTNADKACFAEFDVGGVKARSLLVKFARKGANQRLAGMAADGDSPATFQYAMFDQVVFGTGRTRGYNTPKTAEELQLGAATSLVWPFKDKLVKIPGEYDFPVGVKTSDDRVRLVGAAGLNSWVIVQPGQPNPLAAYEKSLPVQARVNGEGVCLSAATIAYANQYFLSLAKGPKLNYNVNTATLEDLQGLLSDGDLAEDILDLRHFRIGPFISVRQLARALQIYRSAIKEDELIPDAIPPDLVARLNNEEVLSAGRISDDEKVALKALEDKLTNKVKFSYARNAVIEKAGNLAK